MVKKSDSAYEFAATGHSGETRSRTPTVECAVAREKRTRYKSRLERDFAGVLEALRLNGDIEWWDYEAFGFRLGDGCYYYPDFTALFADKIITCYEVKGKPREKGRVKFRTAVEKFWFFRWTWVTRKHGVWQYDSF